MPRVPHPALYAKPVKRKKLVHVNSRAEVFKSHYTKLCKERNMPIFERLLYGVDQAVDSDVPLQELSFSGLQWSKAEFNVVFDALTAAKDYTFVEDEDFSENMKLSMIDFSGHRAAMAEKGFFQDLEKHFGNLSKFPYEIGGVMFRSCGLDDKAVEALRPAIVKLKMLARADFSKNLLKEEGVKTLILTLRDANASFSELTLNNSSLHDPKYLKLVAAMLDKNSSITKLDLSNCGITDMGVLFLMKGLVNHPRIRFLDMSGNKLGSSRASADMFVWAQRTSSLEVFKMARTEMGPKSCKAVSSLLEDPASILKCIDISGNDYGPKGGALILQALAKNAMLQEVHLGGMEINEKNVEGLLKFFKRACKTLQHVDLRGTPIGKRGLSVILEELGDSCSKLKVLDLGRIAFLGKANGTALLSFMEKSQSLETLIMTAATFDKESWPLFCRSVQQSKVLKRLELDVISLARCPLADLRDALQQVPNVREVSLRQCEMTPEVLLVFLGLFNAASNSGLRVLDVRGNKELLNIPQHKKYGPLLAKALETAYLKLDYDKKVK